jgi:hypothetical protein
MRGQKERIRRTTGVGQLSGVEQGGWQVDQASETGHRFHEIEHEVRFTVRERRIERCQVQRTGNGFDAVSEARQRLPDGVGLTQDILLVRRGICGNGLVEDADAHG